MSWDLSVRYWRRKESCRCEGLDLNSGEEIYRYLGTFLFGIGDRTNHIDVKGFWFKLGWQNFQMSLDLSFRAGRQNTSCRCGERLDVNFGGTRCLGTVFFGLRRLNKFRICKNLHVNSDGQILDVLAPFSAVRRQNVFCRYERVGVNSVRKFTDILGPFCLG